MVYSGLNESEIKWVGQVRNFDEMGGQFDIKPYFLALSWYGAGSVEAWMAQSSCFFL